MGEGLKTGDVVQLKSGGPLMTITSVGNDGNHQPMIRCTWFELSEQKKGHFPPETVEIYVDE